MKIQRTLILATVTTLVMSSCGGGGGGSGPVAAAPTSGGGSGVSPPTFTVGAVSGFGSVVVNNVRYDNNKARLSVEDGDDDGTGLKLGQVVRLEGKVNDDRVTGTANSIEMQAEIKGPVESKASATSFVAMGATVNTNSFTVYDSVAPDLSNLAVGDIVQVHGLPDASGVVTATRVQKRAGTPLQVYKTVGVVAAAPAPSATQFKLGTLTVGYSQSVVRDLPVPLPVGAIVRIKTSTAPAAGQVAATQVRPFVSGPQQNASQAELNGFVAGLTASSFTLNGVLVNYSASTAFERGVLADLANGRQVEIKGSIANGVITATLIKFEDVSGKEYQFTGAVSNFVSAADFVVQGQRIDASGSNVRFDDGTAADLANGKNVEVRGGVIDQGKLIATRVKFK
jgi:hypothetical protein